MRCPVVLMLLGMCVPGLAHAERLAGAPDLLSVSGHRGDAVAVGAFGAVFFYSGKRGRWTRQEVPTTVGVNDVVMLSSRDIWAVAVGGQKLHYDGRGWSSPAGSTSRSYYGLAMSDSRTGVIVGHGGRIFHLVDREWKQFSGPTTKTLRAVAHLGRGRDAEWIAVGDDGTVVVMRGVGGAISAAVESLAGEANLVAVTACSGHQPEALVVGSGVWLRSSTGMFTQLPAPPTPLKEAIVACRSGAVKRVFGATHAAVAVFEVGKQGWGRYPVSDAASLAGIAWLSDTRFAVVGAEGSATIVAARKAAALARGL